jgi:hypothetical protein
MENTTQLPEVESQQLKHGHFKVKLIKLNDIKTHDIVDSIAKPLNQEELADGWLQVLKKNRKLIHHFNIYLSQLPMNLWGKVQKTFSKSTDDNDYYKKIKNKNYHYTIKHTDNDELIFKLYQNILSKNPNLDVINDLYKDLEEKRVKGWVMIRAHNLLLRKL